MNLSNVHGLPDALVHAIENDPYVGGGDISVTRLIDAPQRRTLYKKYHEAVVVDVSTRLFSLLGQAVHTILERSNKTGLAEERLYAEINGWKVSGQFDRIDLNKGVLEDYKVCSTYKADGSIEWERQLNVLRWLAAKNGHEIKALRVIALYRDWSKIKTSRDPEYPSIPVGMLEIPIWDIEQAEQYVAQRVEIHQKAEREPVLCTDEERWFTGNKWALKKKGGKRAIRVYERKEDVPEPEKDQVIEERVGQYRRCEEYCDVAPFCQQWQQTAKPTEEE